MTYILVRLVKKEVLPWTKNKILINLNISNSPHIKVYNDKFKNFIKVSIYIKTCNFLNGHSMIVQVNVISLITYVTVIPVFCMFRNQYESRLVIFTDAIKIKLVFRLPNVKTSTVVRL